MRWHKTHGKWWMIQWGRPIFFSFGIHVDSHLKYVDFHLIAMIITLGNMEETYREYKAWWSSRSL
jgi:hypothetical protein